MKILTRQIFNSLFFLSAVGVSNTSFAGEGEISDPITHGEEAHKNHCYKCHTDSVYTRDNRFVKSIDALSKQVVRCKEGSDVPWFDEDADAVVQFLNKKYYRF
ncbi:MAG: cytochrome c [Proteobacteria bacterium]|nr:cytochrome c [Pseudomonadota bacterium]